MCQRGQRKGENNCVKSRDTQRPYSDLLQCADIEFLISHELLEEGSFD